MSLSSTQKDSITLQSHILASEARQQNATGTLSWILSALSISAKMIAANVRRALLDDVLGEVGSDNVQGEAQQKLDVIANDILLRILGARDGVAIVASEENEEPVIIGEADDDQKYCILFDPLDGSSNLDVCGGVGTIFSILRNRSGLSAKDSLLQVGTEQVAAGYILYGSSTIFTLTVGDGVDMFVLDPSIGAFIRVATNLRIPDSNKSYSLNEGNRLSFPQGYQDYLHWAQSNGYSSRYAGAMVADVHRILLKGGVFMYPPTQKAPAGKLRLMYEANPMAMLVEQAGGKAMCDPSLAIQNVQPTDIHQRVPVIMGSTAEVDRVLGFLQ